MFPIERLPQWAQFILVKEKDFNVIENICPLFKGKVNVKGLNQIQLNVFEYFMFWFAYYPVCKGNSESSDTSKVLRNTKNRLENWAHSLPRFPTVKKVCEKKVEYSLYMRLLYAHMREFVPMSDLGVQPYRSSLLHYSSSVDSSATDRTEFFVNTLIQFWLVDNDFSPVPVNFCKLFGVSFPFRSFIGESPPTSGLGEVVSIFVKYLNLSSVASIEMSSDTEWSKMSDIVTSAVGSVGCWNLLVQRPLYRYILRTFLFCPVETSIKNVSQVFLVWMSYIEPWAINLSDFKELEANIGELCKSKTVALFGSKAPSGYSSSWLGFVLCNYLFFSSLVTHFIGFAHKFLHADPEAIVKMVEKVMGILTSSAELIDLLKNVDTEFHAVPLRSSKSTLKSLQRYVPTIHEQLQDWEDGLCESDADGSFLHDNWNKDLRLFCRSENGGQQLLQLFVLRAESELQAISSDTVNLQSLDSIKQKITQFFGVSPVKPLSIPFEEKHLQDPRHEIFKPRRLGNGTSTDIKYKGDWMKRPVSNDEVAWLAKLLVSLSCWLNGLLGLNQDQNVDRAENLGPGWSYVDVSNDVLSVSGSAELARVICCIVATWFIAICRGAVWCLRKYGIRVNLRVLASKKVLTVLLMTFGLNFIWKSITGA